jgi:hypothetical protein
MQGHRIVESEFCTYYQDMTVEWHQYSDCKYRAAAMNRMIWPTGHVAHWPTGMTPAGIKGRSPLSINSVSKIMVATCSYKISQLPTTTYWISLSLRRCTLLVHSIQLRLKSKRPVVYRRQTSEYFIQSE